MLHPQFHTASAQAAPVFTAFPVLASHIQSIPVSLRPSTAFRRWEANHVAGSSTSLRLVVRCQAGSDSASSTKTVRTIPTTTGVDVSVKAIVTVQEPTVNFFTNVVNKALDDIGDLFGKSLLLDFVSAELDPKTGLEKRAVTTFAHKGTSPGDGYVAYEADFTLPADFGEVGAILLENEHHKEMFVSDIVLKRSDYDHPVSIQVQSWVHSKFDDPDKRIFFSKSYLPSQTPAPLRKLRLRELMKVRGDGQGTRKPYERIYDYDVYNDLGNPDESKDLARPVLGGKKHPFPRRCRTGRPMSKSEPHTESRGGQTYVPRDEHFAAVKQSTFSITTLRSVLHAVLPGLESVLLDPKQPFSSFRDIDSLFNEGLIMPKSEGIQQVTGLLPSLLKVITDRADSILQFELPALHDKDRFSWLTDEEFSRQTLAGPNPICIELVREFPFVSKLDHKVYGPPESAITKEIVEREIRSVMTVEQAIEQKRLFILDYHDVFLPYVNKIRELGNNTAYGSRTIFFRHHDDCLEPIVIELTRPPSKTQPQCWKQAFTHCYDATGAWLWRLAKLHATTHDTGFHQLVSHWLRTHSCVEPYVIAANRQLSTMHPVYRLLQPHFRYTMEINALARESLISAGGIIETSFFPGKYSMELSSVAYDKLWRFDMEALPADLVRRGMAVEDPEAEHGLKLIIEDYPYANDGLLVWSAIEQWVQDFVSHYYPDADTVTGDQELQAWWHEVRNKGHADKKDEPWWPQLDGTASLVRTLTTIIWVTSCHHAAVNFGQYHYGGYFPNRPTVVRRNMPIEEGGECLKSFMNKPERSLLESLPSQLQATVVMAILDVLSSHSPDEEYIGKQTEHWAFEPIIRAAYERFAGRLQEIEGIIDDRNLNPKLKNRFGAGVVPYELLKPTSEPGVTGRGVPNSISI